MQISYHKHFKKQFLKISPKIQKQFEEKITIFIQNPFDPVLNNHTLKGKYSNYRSINITGDIRAIYILDKDIAIFLFIGSHSELYK